MIELDETDQKLIAELRRDGRASVSELAARIGVTRATVRARMARLEDRGEVLGYAVVLKADAQAAPVRGIMLLEIEGRGTERVVAHLSRSPSVTEIHSTNGRWDLVVELGADDLEAFDHALRAIRLIDGVARSETSLLLATRRGGAPRRGGGAS